MGQIIATDIKNIGLEEKILECRGSVRPGDEGDMMKCVLKYNDPYKSRGATYFHYFRPEDMTYQWTRDMTLAKKFKTEEKATSFITRHQLDVTVVEYMEPYELAYERAMKGI